MGRLRLDCGSGNMDVVLVETAGQLEIIPYDLSWSQGGGTRRIHELLGGGQFYSSRSGASGAGWVPDTWRVKKLKTYRVDTGALNGLPSSWTMKEADRGLDAIYIPIHYRDRRIAGDWPLVVLSGTPCEPLLEMVGWQWGEWIQTGMIFHEDRPISFELEFFTRGGLSKTEKFEVPVWGPVASRRAKTVCSQFYATPEERVSRIGLDRTWWGFFGIEWQAYGFPEPYATIILVAGRGGVIRKIVYPQDLLEDPAATLGDIRPNVCWVTPEIAISFPRKPGDTGWISRRIGDGKNGYHVPAPSRLLHAVVRMAEHPKGLEFLEVVTNETPRAQEFLDPEVIRNYNLDPEEWKSAVEWAVDLFYGFGGPSDPDKVLLSRLTSYLKGSPTE